MSLWTQICGMAGGSMFARTGIKSKQMSWFRVQGYEQWRNHAWSIMVNDQVALWTDQVALPSDLIKQFM